MKHQEGSGTAKCGYWDMEQGCGVERRSGFQQFRLVEVRLCTAEADNPASALHFSNFGSLKCACAAVRVPHPHDQRRFQQFRLVEVRLCDGKLGYVAGREAISAISAR